MRNDTEWLKDILDEIALIEKYSVKGELAFQKDELIQTWMIHHLQTIGEAAGKLSENLKQKYPSIPWRDIISMRNFIVHQYFGVDLEEIWNTVTHDIPVLKNNLNQVLKDPDNS
ncbi:MAG TPA: DUF86 domain-containing protein [Ignavibacteriales bacterium]|nr:DUF86 domain-containing protein [Ignavibacteriales bacterium]